MASNPYVNKVQYSDGTTIIDISTDTAVAADVTAGKYFHLATGERVAGTNSGGSGDGYVWQDANGYVHLSDEEGTQPIFDTLNVNASGTFTPAQGHAYNSVVVPSGTSGTPTASKGTVSNHSVSVTPSVTNTAGYISGGTKTGTAVSVSASELVSGTYNVSSSGTKDVANYASASVPAGTATPASSISGTSATVSTGTNTLTLSKTISNTPTVSAGYISSGTAGNSSVSLTANVTTKGAATITPTTTNQTIASGTYITGTQTISGDSNLVAGNIKNGTTIFGVTGSYSGGGGSSYTPVSVGVLEVTANVTSTSVTTITTALTIDTSAITSTKMLYVKIRDKAGKRNGYFFGTDLFFPVWAENSGTTQNPAKQVYSISSLGKIGLYTPASTTCYGVYVSGITNLGEVYVMGRYNSSYSLTINGTYSIDIYTLGWPNDVSPIV